MNRKMKIVSCFLTLSLLATLFAGMGSISVNALQSGDYQYADNGDYVTITKYVGTAATVTIPSLIAGKPVREIGDEAFIYAINITGITIPDSVRTIGYRAFYRCNSLTNIVIPEGVASIGMDALSDCKSLTTVNLPDSLVNIGGYLFWNCQKLTSVRLPANLVKIPDGLFLGCYELANITIPATVNAFGRYAFNNCFKLTSINIPTAVTVLPNYIFAGCTMLTSISIPYGVTDIQDCAFIQCNSLQNVSIPSTVVRIGTSAFEECWKISSVDIPAGVTAIESETFMNCTGLTSLTIPDGVTSIGEYAFYGCSKLTGIELPDQLTNIGIAAFTNCKEITDIVIPNNITVIESAAFDGCTSLSQVTLPTNLTKINIRAFAGCASLTDLTIPETVIFFGSEAFSGCTKLANINLPENITIISFSLFKDCKILKNINIPVNVVKIDQNAFNGCAALENAVIPDKVTEIGDYAFSGCTSLKNALIPARVESIGNYAFSQCVLLQNINIPNSTRSLGRSAFDGCTNLTTVVIQYNLRTIASGTFNQCVNLTDLYLPYSMSGIDNYEFATCPKLRIHSYDRSYGQLFASQKLIPFILITEPQAPVNLTLTGKTDRTATLSWTSVSGAQSYHVVKDGYIVNLEPVTGTSYTVTGLSPITPYWFSVISENQNGVESSTGAEIKVTTFGDPLHFTVSDATGKIGGTAVVDVNSGEPARISDLSFVIHYDPAKLELVSAAKGPSFDGGTAVIVNDTTAGNITVTYHNNGIFVNAGNLLHIVLKITDRKPGDVIPVDMTVNTISDDVGFPVFQTVKQGSVTTTGEPPPPIGLKALFVAQDSLSLSWDASETATGYFILQDGVKINEFPYTGTDHRITDLLPKTAYSFTIIAVNGYGESYPGNALPVFTTGFPVNLDMIPTTGYPGQICSVKINISADSQMSAGTFQLTYDSTQLEYISIEPGSITESEKWNTTVSDSKLIFTYDGSSGINSSGTLFEVRMRIKEGIPDQIIPLSLIATGLSDFEDWPLPPAISQGTVTVLNYTLGDLNNDGSITTLDALIALQIVSGRLAGPTSRMLLAADVTKDGLVTTIDALKILQFVSGRITGF